VFRLRSSRRSACASLFTIADRRPKQVGDAAEIVARMRRLVLKHHFWVKFIVSETNRKTIE
jgi:hypothetical protein